MIDLLCTLVPTEVQELLTKVGDPSEDCRNVIVTSLQSVEYGKVYTFTIAYATRHTHALATKKTAREKQ